MEHKTFNNAIGVVTLEEQRKAVGNIDENDAYVIGRLFLETQDSRSSSGDKIGNHESFHLRADFNNLNQVAIEAETMSMILAN